MFGIRKLLRQILERLQVLENAASSSAEENAQSAERVARRLAELSGAANRHDMAIEDLLDSWEELREKQTQEAQALSSALQDAAAREQKEARARETALLKALLSAHDQLFALQKAAAEAGAEDWLRQLALAEQKLEETRLPAGLRGIEERAPHRWATAARNASLFWTRFCCLMKEREKNLPLIPVIRRDYPYAYTYIRTYCEQLASDKAEEQAQRLKREYARLSEQYEGGDYYERYPEEKPLPRGVVAYSDDKPFVRETKKPGRNDPCP